MDSVASEEYRNRFLDFYNAYYASQINEMYIAYPKKRSVPIDIKDLEKYDIELANELMDKPDNVLESAHSALRSLNPNQDAKEPAYARFFGVDKEDILIQDVGSECIGKMLTLDSLVVKRSEIIPMVRIGMLKCMFCGSTITVRIESEKAPDSCPQCGRRSLKQMSENSEFINLQKIAVQDPLERLRGSMPSWQLEVWIEDDMVNTVIPGDRVEITGVLRIRPRKTSRGKEEKFLFTMMLDAVSIKQRQKEFAEIDITEEEGKRIEELAKDQGIFDKISKSIAPQIYGYPEIKRSLALQLFSGTQDKMMIDGSKIRSDIHILLIGDPGSAKTRFLQSVTNLVPKGIYVSGKSTSSAGLTASAERDEFSEGGWTLKAGALVLGSGGEVSIDEFDKISNDDKAALHEALESQTISVAKAGIVASFNAKTSVLAAANPKYGRFDQNEVLVGQFDIPPALLSRFDLIFPILDMKDEETDRRIARHILTQHEAAGAIIAEIKEYEQVESPPIDAGLLRKYIAYAKKRVKPRLLPEASKRIQDYYVELRRIGFQQGGATPMTPRQIEGLIRLAEASAKTRLSDKVELKDAELAISLFEHMLKTLAVDRSGRIDIDVFMTGMPKEKVERINTLMTIIKRLEKEEEVASVKRILEEAEKANIDKQTTTKYLYELERQGDLYSPKAGIIKIVKRDEF